jgi:hypothetical protein
MRQTSTLHKVIMTFRSSPPLSPDEVRLRELFLRSGSFILAFFWSIFIVQQILFVYQLIIAGIPVKLFNQFAHHRVSSAAIILISYLTIYALVVCFLIPEIKRVLQECFERHGFARLYYSCSYLGPTKRPLRFSQSVVLQSEDVTYNYSNSSFLLATEKRVHTLPSSEVTRNVVESTIVSSEPNAADGEIYASASIPQSVPQLEETVSPTVKYDQEPNSHGLLDTKTCLLISLAQGNICISLAIEVNGKLTEIEKDIIKNLKWKALIVFLALQEERVPIDTTSILKAIYDDDTDETRDQFYHDVSRLRLHIRNKAKKKGLSSVNPFMSGRGNSGWRSSSVCKVREIKFLLLCYWKIKGIQMAVENIKEPESKALRSDCIRLIEDYSGNYIGRHQDEDAYVGGYLFHYLHADPFRSWAPEKFNTYRDMYIFNLRYVAECEYARRERIQDKQCLKIAARLTKECAYAATQEPINSSEGEKALRMCINMSILLKDKEAAQQVCDVYRRRVRRVFIEWEPEDATIALMQKHLLIND